jgi:hypothetical protein
MAGDASSASRESLARPLQHLSSGAMAESSRKLIAHESSAQQKRKKKKKKEDEEEEEEEEPSSSPSGLSLILSASCVSFSLSLLFLIAPAKDPVLGN